jgi:5'-deoxynucleotidase YfbR-like HD superfamily hydrolase
MIKEIRNGFQVRRYHTCRRLQTETVGHHSANIQAIIIKVDPAASRELLIAALFHDVAEYYTGDVPYPYKRDNPGVKKELDADEGIWMRKHSIPQPMITPKEAALLKFADMMELVLTSIEELNMGNQYAKAEIDAGEDYIRNMDIPESWMRIAEALVQEAKDVQS